MYTPRSTAIYTPRASLAQFGTPRLKRTFSEVAGVVQSQLALSKETARRQLAVGAAGY